MTTKLQLNARVRILAGPAQGLWGRIASANESTWTAHGRAAADNVNIRGTGLGSSSASSPKSIGGGR